MAKLARITQEQKEAINGLLRWSTIPGSTLAYASAVAGEASYVSRTPLAKELDELGGLMLKLEDAFGWSEIE